jgi:hypothetical protein
MEKKNKGSTLDSLLDAEGIREECEANAINKVIAWEQQYELDTKNNRQYLANQLDTNFTETKKHR